MTPGGNPSRGTAAPSEKISSPQLSSWVLLISAVVLKASLISICLVVPLHHNSEHHQALQQNFKELHCISAMAEGNEQGWMCCPKGWKHFQKSCYYLSADEMPGVESVQNCTGMSSHLVVINSEEEQVFLTNELQQFPKAVNYYIGLTAQGKGKWQWVDQTPFNEKAAFWRKGEPNYANDENCVVIHTSTDIRNWNDISCKTLCQWICEAAALTVMERPSC